MHSIEGCCTATTTALLLNRRLDATQNPYVALHKEFIRGGQLTFKYKDILEPSHANFSCGKCHLIYVMEGVWRLHTRSVLKRSIRALKGWPVAYLTPCPTKDLNSYVLAEALFKMLMAFGLSTIYYGFLESYTWYKWFRYWTHYTTWQIFHISLITGEIPAWIYHRAKVLDYLLQLA